MTSRRARPLLVGILVTGVLVAPSARADDPPAEDPAAARAPAAPADPVALEARAHHRRGLELYDEGDFRLALVELERAHTLSRSYKILFNIGQVHFQLLSYAKARLAFEQYLALGGDQINEKRRADVERDLATLRTRTATLTVRVNVESADVNINDTSIGKAPLEAAVVDAGTLRIQVTRPGYGARVREITLAGGDEQTVTVDLVESKPDVLVTNTTTGLPGPAIAGWIVTGILTAGTIGTAIAANAASSKYEAQRETPISGSPSEARADLERQRNLVSALALTTDVLAISTLIAGGISLYLTLRDKPKPDAPRVRPAAAGAFVTLGF